MSQSDLIAQVTAAVLAALNTGKPVAAPASKKPAKKGLVGFANTMTQTVAQPASPKGKKGSHRKVSAAEPLPAGDQTVRPYWAAAFPLIADTIAKSGAKLHDWRFCGKPGEAVGDKPWLYVQFENKAEAGKVKDLLKQNFGAQFSQKFSGSDGTLSTWIMTGRMSMEYGDDSAVTK